MALIMELVEKQHQAGCIKPTVCAEGGPILEAHAEAERKELLGQRLTSFECCRLHVLVHTSVYCSKVVVLNI